MPKSKLTPELKEEIVDKVAEGNYLKVAAESSGISEKTFYRWMNQGAQEEVGIYRQLHDEVKKAEYSAETRGVQEWTRAGDRDWKAWDKFLSKRYPERWADSQRIELLVDKEIDHMMASLENSLDPEDFRKVMGVLANSESDVE